MDLYQRAYQRIKQAQMQHATSTTVHWEDTTAEDAQAVVERLQAEGYRADLLNDYVAYIAVSWDHMP